MTTPSASAPAAPVLLLSQVAGQPVRDPGGRQLGRLKDLVVTLPAGGQRPVVRGVVLNLQERDLFIGADRIAQMGPEGVRLASAVADLRPFARRAGEVLLREDILGHRLVDLERPGLVRAHDAALEPAPGAWRIAAVDLHRGGWRGVLRGRREHLLRDWADFEVLIGHQASAAQRGPRARLLRLRPAHLADLLQSATPAEQVELLNEVHDDPELEADVFEELEDAEQAELLAERSNTDIAAVLARMQTDDAADALLDLPQARRRPVLAALPPTQRERVTALLGYAEQTAGGLMTPDVITVAPSATAADALAEVRASGEHQLQALSVVLVVDTSGRLRAALPLARAVQAHPATPVERIAEPDPVRVHPSADAVAITRAMADHNLLALPVVDDADRLLGVVTVDDALELAIPPDWRRREGSG